MAPITTFRKRGAAESPARRTHNLEFYLLCRCRGKPPGCLGTRPFYSPANATCDGENSTYQTYLWARPTDPMITSNLSLLGPPFRIAGLRWCPSTVVIFRVPRSSTVISKIRSFAPDDFRACLIVGSRFKNCSFKGSLWHQIDVKQTVFEECDFREASIRESHFSQSHLAHCRFRKSLSITLNEFTTCAFGDVNLGDCTALFLIFNACQFDRCRINAETIGFTFGLSEANLNALSFNLPREAAT